MQFLQRLHNTELDLKVWKPLFEILIEDEEGIFIVRNKQKVLSRFQTKKVLFVFSNSERHWRKTS